MLNNSNMLQECPIAFNTSGRGADLALGDTSASPVVLMSFGWNSPQRTEVFILKVCKLLLPFVVFVDTEV